ncbi:MAG: hypothetical protein WAV54_15575 [Acidimicrobiales bacterium]
MYRDGTGPALLFLHGFGSTKEDYADAVFEEHLTAGRSWPKTRRGVVPGE